MKLGRWQGLSQKERQQEEELTSMVLDVGDCDTAIMWSWERSQISEPGEARASHCQGRTGLGAWDACPTCYWVLRPCIPLLCTVIQTSGPPCPSPLPPSPTASGSRTQLQLSHLQHPPVQALAISPTQRLRFPCHLPPHPTQQPSERLKREVRAHASPL